MATYNGESHINDQINSILNQSWPYFSIIVRDDGSTDRTMEIIKDYKKIYNKKIKIIRDGLGNLGSSKCFMELLTYSDADYIMFCDQDDIWRPNKIKITIEKMKRLEEIYDKETPILIFTDLSVIDKNSNIVSESFWGYQKLDPIISKNWRALLASNVITGCTIMMNRKAKDVVLPFKLPNMIHDHWVGVNISKYGIVDYICTQTVLYRQHFDNVIGAHKFNLKYIFIKIFKIKKLMKRMKIYYGAAKYFKISFLELMVLQIKINFLRIIK